MTLLVATCFTRPAFDSAWPACAGKAGGRETGVAGPTCLNEAAGDSQMLALEGTKKGGLVICREAGSREVRRAGRCHE